MQVTALSETGQLAACVSNVQDAPKGEKEEDEKGALVKNDIEDGHPDVKKDDDDEVRDGLLDGETVLDEEGTFVRTYDSPSFRARKYGPPLFRFRARTNPPSSGPVQVHGTYDLHPRPG